MPAISVAKGGQGGRASPNYNATNGKNVTKKSTVSLVYFSIFRVQ